MVSIPSTAAILLSRTNVPNFQSIVTICLKKFAPSTKKVVVIEREASELIHIWSILRHLEIHYLDTFHYF